MELGKVTPRSSMREDRVFSEQEVAEIMRRAVTLQETAKEGGAEYRPGVTKAELQRAAKEMGVDPAFLEQAILEKLDGVPAKHHGYLPEEQRVVEGELDPADFDIILDQIKTRARSRNPITQVGRSLRGQTFTGSGLANLEITSRNGRTRINLKPFPVFEILGTFYPAFLVSMIAGGSLAQHGMGGIATAVAGGAFGLAILGFRQWISKSREATARLADKLQSAVSDHVGKDLRENLGAVPAAEESKENADIEQNQST